jgi:alkyl hydroperoxide reductase subunit AhpC
MQNNSMGYIMKLSVGIGGFLLSLVIIIYVMAFTPVGNTFIAPGIEEAIKEKTKLQSKLIKFSLDKEYSSILLFTNSSA